MDPPSDAGRLTPRERAWLIGIGVLYAAVVIPIGVHKGGDFTQELTRSERLLSGVPLYVENPRGGIWWPPFTALGLVPFALVARWSLALAKAGWAALNVVSLGWTVARARAWTTGWTPVVLALAAVGKPLQSNYEHLNLTPILLALVVAGAADLEARQDGRAGWWIGLATAIKGFPALLLLYFAYRGRWRACGTLAAGAQPQPGREGDGEDAHPGRDPRPPRARRSRRRRDGANVTRVERLLELFEIVPQVFR